LLPSEQAKSIVIFCLLSHDTAAPEFGTVGSTDCGASAAVGDALSGDNIVLVRDALLLVVAGGSPVVSVVPSAVVVARSTHL